METLWWQQLTAPTSSILRCCGAEGPTRGGSGGILKEDIPARPPNPDQTAKGDIPLGRRPEEAEGDIPTLRKTIPQLCIDLAAAEAGSRAEETSCRPTFVETGSAV